ncbi:helix-turn-helix domain-containing protein [Allomuricauda sp. ARW1Y1]|jgi:transcriptional regulator with XRE-family HTH domain|uniref:helix-turn-helix domain-containing protein n=1 Tax=Allomuricauda sp. ARW1Y1 TaxID=2663843 RepID=UPI0015CA3880|nr:helix-turn-helix transcriptional regulator [Muricauda sp. ARW1Y1]NYJ28190.1 transcriptional regulator with XRE-family HTH domain [Muricauda sp. ARW1Y1]
MNSQNHKRKKAIAKRIKELRINSGYSSYETFATDNGLSRKNYWRIEKGGNFNITTLLKITTIHGITLEEFFKGIK